MREMISATPFGQRPVTLGHIAAQMRAGQAIDDAAKAGSNQPAAVNKWNLFRTLTQVRAQLGISDRSLSVLNALLSFHQETALSLPVPGKTGDPCGGDDGQGDSCDLIVFPSNRALCLRAHGMAEKTLRRHLAGLVDAGLIIRRDSPNGKRYARKDATGKARFSDAFGFDLTPLVTRASEFEAMADELRRQRQATAVLKERISLHRRDIAKLIALGLDEGLEGGWEAFRQRFLGLVTPLRQIKSGAGLGGLAAELAALRDEVSKTLEIHINSKNMSGNDGHNDRHQSNTNTQSTKDFEPASKEDRGETADVREKPDKFAETDNPAWPLGLVMEACPDVRDYAAGGAVRNWAGFLDSVRLIRPMIGVSPHAWAEALAIFGERQAHVVVATILQRCEYSSEARSSPGDGAGERIISVNNSPAIKSPGGYLRALTLKAREGDFALGPVLMALIGQRLKAKRDAKSEALK